MIIAGFDLGTAAIKAVFINEKKELLWTKAVPSCPEALSITEKLIDEGKECVLGIKDSIAGIATTGYGKHALPYTDIAVDEISALSLGAYILSRGEARTVINIGGQDSKIVKIADDGRVIDFKMNDKCAAGTGRFLEMAARILNVPLDAFGNLEDTSQLPIAINSTCAVFAESEIVSLLYNKINKNDIIAGFYRSIAKRISDLIQGLCIEEEIYLDGGPAQNKGLLIALEKETKRKIKIFSYPQFTTAIGAALVLLKRT